MLTTGAESAFLVGDKKATSSRRENEVEILFGMDRSL